MSRSLSETEKQALANLKTVLARTPAPAHENIDPEVIQEFCRIGKSLLLAPTDITTLTGPVVELAQVANWFFISRQGIMQASTKERLIGFKYGRKWYYPSWQLVSSRAIPKIIQQVNTLLPTRYTTLMQASWYMQAQEKLNGYTPAQVINGKGAHHLIELLPELASAAPARLVVSGQEITPLTQLPLGDITQ